MKNLLNPVLAFVLASCAYGQGPHPPGVAKSVPGKLDTTKAELRRALARPDAMSAQPVAMASAPVSTVSASTSFSAAQSIAYDDPRLRIVGRVRHVGNGYGNFGVGAGRGTGTHNTDNVWGVEFLFDGSAFELKDQEFGKLRLWVDGQLAETITSPAGGGAINYRKWDFGPRAIRHIRIQLFSDTFLGIQCDASDNVMPATGERTTKLTILGDSYTAGGGGSNPLASWAQTLGRIMNCQTDAEAIGGTGYLNDNGVKGNDFVSRFALDVPLASPDVLVIAGGINDRTSINAAYTSVARRAAAASLFSLAKSTCPDAFIVVVGTWNVDSIKAASPDFTDVRDDLKAMALAAKLPFIDPLTGNVYDGTGAVALTGKGPWFSGTRTSANSGTAPAYTYADDVHATQAGHDAIARFVASAILALLGQPMPPSGIRQHPAHVL